MSCERAVNRELVAPSGAIHTIELMLSAVHVHGAACSHCSYIASAAVADDVLLLLRY